MVIESEENDAEGNAQVYDYALDSLNNSKYSKLKSTSNLQRVCNNPDILFHNYSLKGRKHMNLKY